jgi:hypothetical protein
VPAGTHARCDERTGEMEGPPSKRASTALTVSIASVVMVCCGPVAALAGLVAAIAAGMEMTAIDLGQAPIAGRRMAVWGLVLGIIGTVVGAFTTLFGMALIAGMAQMSSGQ